MSLIILSYSIDFCFSLQSYYNRRKCELRKEALVIPEKTKMCQGDGNRDATETLWGEQFESKRKCMWSYTQWHTYIQPEDYFMTEKREWQLHQASHVPDKIFLENTHLFLFSFFQHSQLIIWLPTCSASRKECAGYNHRVCWSLWQFWLFLSTHSPFSCTCVPCEFS